MDKNVVKLIVHYSCATGKIIVFILMILREIFLVILHDLVNP